MLQIIAYEEKTMASGCTVFSVAYLTKNGKAEKAIFQNVSGSIDMIYGNCKEVKNIREFIKEYNEDK